MFPQQRLEDGHGAQGYILPPLAGYARGQAGKSDIRIHSRKDSAAQAWTAIITFSVTQDTAFYRLWTSAETVSFVVTLMAHGYLLQAIERLHATFREPLASLARRGRARARRILTVQHRIYRIETIYKFCTPHAGLAYTDSATTSAIAADITIHCWPV
jgi:hypothetical protein